MPGMLEAPSVPFLDAEPMAGELTTIALGDRRPPRDEARELPHLRETQRALEVGEPIVESELVDLVVPGPVALGQRGVSTNPMMTEAPHAVRQVRRAREHHSALAGGDVLDRMEAEHHHVGGA